MESDIINFQKEIIAEYKSAIDTKVNTESQANTLLNNQKKEIEYRFSEKKKLLTSTFDDAVEKAINGEEKKKEIIKLEHRKKQNELKNKFESEIIRLVEKNNNDIESLIKWKKKELAATKKELNIITKQLDNQLTTLTNNKDRIDVYLKKSKWNTLILQNKKKYTFTEKELQKDENYKELCEKNLKVAVNSYKYIANSKLKKPYGIESHLVIWLGSILIGISLFGLFHNVGNIILFGLLLTVTFLLSKWFTNSDMRFIENCIRLDASTEKFKHCKKDYLEMSKKRYKKDLSNIDNTFNYSTKVMISDFERKKKELEKDYQVSFAINEEEKDNKINKLNIVIRNKKKLIEESRKNQLRIFENDYTNTIKSLSEEHEKSLATIANKWEKAKRDFNKQTKMLYNMFPKWNISISNDEFAVKSYPKGFRIGDINLVYKSIKVSMPAIIPFPIEKALIYKSDIGCNDVIIDNIHSFLLRVLLGFPPSKVNFIFIDPVRLGKNVGSFLNFLDYDENIIHNQAIYETNQIEQILLQLTDRMALITQKFLRNQFHTLEEYNKTAGELAEPYQVLVVFDFPQNFTKELAERLNRIVKSGYTCGIFTVIVFDNSSKSIKENNYQKILDAGNHIVEISSTSLYRLSYFKEFDLTIDSPPNQMEKIINKIGEDCVNNKNIVIPFAKLLEISKLPSSGYWKENTTEGLTIPIGLIGTLKPQNIKFGKGTSQHLLIGGKTGAGKSSLLHTIITSSCLRYSPDELQLLLIDFKKGVEFKRYANSKLPHAQVIAIESEREFGLSVLERVNEEIQKRGILFRGKGVEGFKEFRLKSKKPLPRLLLIIDEYQEFFSIDSDEIATKSAQILDRIVRQGRAFGVHLILGSQTISGSYNISRSTLDQIAIRIALQCSEDDSRLILGSDNPAARLLSRPGEAIYNALNGMVEGNYLFQVALLKEQSQQKFLAELSQMQKDNKISPLKKQVIFEGNDTAKIESDMGFKDLLNNQISKQDNNLSYGLIGDPIKIKDTTRIFFKNQSSSNLLIIGQNNKSAQGIILSNIFSISLQSKGKNDSIYFIDYSSIEDLNKKYIEVINKIVNTKIRYGRKNELSLFINEIVDKLDELQKAEVSENGTKQKIFLCINGLHRMKEISSNQFSQVPSFNFSLDSNDTESPGKDNLDSQLSKIFIDGPEYGIHSIIWCDSYKNFNRKLERQLIQEFDLRVLFRLNTDDSINIIDTPMASSLKQNQALFFNDDTGISEKFRPFSAPPFEWLKTLNT